VSTLTNESHCVYAVDEVSTDTPLNMMEAEQLCLQMGSNCSGIQGPCEFEFSPANEKFQLCGAREWVVSVDLGLQCVYTTLASPPENASAWDLPRLPGCLRTNSDGSTLMGPRAMCSDPAKCEVFEGQSEDARIRATLQIPVMICAVATFLTYAVFGVLAHIAHVHDALSLGDRQNSVAGWRQFLHKMVSGGPPEVRQLLSALDDDGDSDKLADTVASTEFAFRKEVLYARNSGGEKWTGACDACVIVETWVKTSQLRVCV
jgi:hypothetical protein